MSDTNDIKVNRFDGHVQTVVKHGAVEFIFGDGQGPISVVCDCFSFGINGGELVNPGGYPLPETQAFLTGVSEAKADNQLFAIAREICQGEVAAYLGSPQCAQHRALHLEEWGTRPLGVQEAFAEMAAALT